MYWYFDLVVILVLFLYLFYNIVLLNKKVNLLFKTVGNLDKQSIEDFKYQRCALILINALYNNKMTKKEDIEYLENFIKEKGDKFKDQESTK